MPPNEEQQLRVASPASGVTSSVMSQTPIITAIVDAIKGYFSINGLILVGVYLVKNPEAAPFGLRFLNYVGGFLAIVAGSIIGMWYTLHLAQRFHSGIGSGSIRGVKVIVYGSFLATALVVIVTVIAGALNMSCEKMFG